MPRKLLVGNSPSPSAQVKVRTVQFLSYGTLAVGQNLVPPIGIVRVNFIIVIDYTFLCSHNCNQNHKDSFSL